MMPPSHKQGIAIILGTGEPPHPMGGEGPDGDMMIPLPDDFDAGDARPGDTLTIQVEGKLSPDGKGLIPMSIDGHKLDPDPDDAPPPPPDEDDMGDKWQEMFGDKR